LKLPEEPVVMVVEQIIGAEAVMLMGRE